MSWLRKISENWRRATARRSHQYLPHFDCLEVRYQMSNGYGLTSLVSDVPGLAAVTDPKLINPWGISFAPNMPFWFSDANSGYSTVYDDTSQTVPYTVAVPVSTNAFSGPGHPTGTVFNGGPGFAVSENGISGPSFFLFATMEGTIAGWNPTVDFNQTDQVVDNSSTPGLGPVYTGLALATNSQGTFLYAANFRAGTIDVLDANFHAVQLSGSFNDPNLPAGFVPFNIQAIGSSLYVTYTDKVAGRYDSSPGLGNGFVDVFNSDGVFLNRLINQGPLNAPWGLALAPGNFGTFSNDLLVGNFGDGHINAFDPQTGAFLDSLSDTTGTPIQIPGLWALTFYSETATDPAASLYLTAGIGDEQHGLFADLQPTAVSSSIVETEGQGSTLAGFLQKLPAGKDDYPVAPTGGPVLRPDTNQTFSTTSVLLPMNDSPLVLVPTLLAGRSTTGSAAPITPLTTPLSISDPRTGPTPGVTVAAFDRASTLASFPGQLPVVTVAAFNRVPTQPPSAFMSWNGGEMGFQRVQLTALTPRESNSQWIFPGITSDTTKSSFGQAEAYPAPEQSSPYVLRSSTRGGINLSIGQWHFHEVTAAPPDWMETSNPTGVSDSLQIQVSASEEDTNANPSPGELTMAGLGSWLPQVPHFLMALLLGWGACILWRKQPRHGQEPMLTTLWSYVSRKFTRTVAIRPQPLLFQDLPQTMVIQQGQP